ncbi:hypothetical protein ACFE04_019379 [Oxalis oulophora]
MAPSRRQSNGRSPLVNPQRQITSFFSKSTSPSPSPSPSPTLSKLNPKSSPNPNPSIKSIFSAKSKSITNNRSRSRSPSPSPTTPSPLQSGFKKPLLVIGRTPSPSPAPSFYKSYSEDVVGKRIKVYWPLDKAWYEGVVKSFDKESSKHLILYDDGQEESVEIWKEKIEWIGESAKGFKRLRRVSSSMIKNSVVVDDDVMEMEDAGDKGKSGSEEKVESVEETSSKFKRLRKASASIKKFVIDDDDEEMENIDGKNNKSDNDDDSSDEDWGKNVNKLDIEDDEESLDLEDEEKVEKKACQVVKKRKVSGGGLSLGSASTNKSKSGGGVKTGGVKNSEPDRNTPSTEFVVLPISDEKACIISDNRLTGDAVERFSARDAEKFPFLGRERRDAKKRRPLDENYDPKTLYLPPDFLKNLSGGQRQWWEFKAKHMDKVLFFKMGRFYELFEMDAHVGSKELDLQYMKGEQPHCGFPEKNFSMHVEKLARKGYRVLVIEQTETPEQLEIRRKEKGSKDKVVKREICAVVTKGTLTDGELLVSNPNASYLMAITEKSQDLADENAERTFGVCVVDVATNKILLGQVKDDLECSALCCLLSELRPEEIIKPANMLSPETESAIIRHTRNPLVNELVPLLEFWDADKTVYELKTVFKRIDDAKEPGSHVINSEEEECDLGCLPNILSELVRAGENGSLALSALGGTLSYLKQAFLDESLLRFADFEILPCMRFGDIAQKPFLVLDAAALENLEIFENSRNGGSSGTLYAQLNHCVTAFGKRLLKTWLARPLYHLEAIKERQDAVSELRGDNLSSAVEFRKAVLRLPDMERLLARIFASSEAIGRNANKVVLYEDASKKQLQEFISALRGCEIMAQACGSLGVILGSIKSKQLHHLLTLGKGFPDVQMILKHFKEAFDWVEANNSGRIVPHEGGDTEYDSACKSVKEMESILIKHLKEQRKLLGETSITYVTVGKESYLLEVPESLRGSVPQDYELRSSKKGFFRYWTPTIKKLLVDLSKAESEKESALKNILQRLVVRFCEHRNNWRQLVSTTAELDVLISLAIASDYYEGPTCRPIIVRSSSTEVPCLVAKGLGHPVLRSDSLGKGTFVPNDITVGGSAHANFILLTGPNMGGKSTLLRQVCLAVILAQVGADVPAESFELSPIDQIFVRMGAKDHIMTGQSTFLTELSETASMLSSATRNSLVALDELGRGTSTSDGQAIAEAVLQHFVYKVQCRGIFSTHYHRLAVDCQQDPKVSLQHMACQVGKGEEGVEEVTFLYRMTAGACPKSYGVNVARLAGIPDFILKKAAAKSREFEATYGKNMKGPATNTSLIPSHVQETVAVIQNLISIATNFSCHENSEITSITSLTELQHKARTFLQQT